MSTAASVAAGPAGVIFAASAILSLAATGVVLRWSRRRSLYDVPNQRSSHRVATPSAGGLGMLVGVLPVLAVSGWWLRSPLLLGAMLPLLVLALTGLLDDRRGIAPLPKMALIVLAGALALPFFGWQSWTQTSPLWISPPAGAIVAGVLAVLWVAFFVNAFNFMDGINGIAAMTAVAAAVTFCSAAARAGDSEAVVFASSVAGAALGFLPWNFPRARIFMGDTGSLSLGGALALLAVAVASPEAERLSSEPREAFAVLVSLFALAPFVLDVVFTLTHRALRGERLTEAHREHIYQRLARLWGSHTPVSLLYAVLAALCGALALASPVLPGWLQGVIYGGVPFVFLLGAFGVLRAASQA